MRTNLRTSRNKWADLNGAVNPYRGLTYQPLSRFYYLNGDKTLTSYATLEDAMTARDRHEARQPSGTWH